MNLRTDQAEASAGMLRLAISYGKLSLVKSENALVNNGKTPELVLIEQLDRLGFRVVSAPDAGTPDAG